MREKVDEKGIKEMGKVENEVEGSKVKKTKKLQ